MKKADTLFAEQLGDPRKFSTNDKVKKIFENQRKLEMIIDYYSYDYSYVLGVYEIEEKSYEMALKSFDNSLSIKKTPICLYAKAKLLAKLAKEDENKANDYYRGALTSLNEAIEYTPHEWRYIFRKVQILVEIKDNGNAATALIDLARCHDSCKEVEDALECLQ